MAEFKPNPGSFLPLLEAQRKDTRRTASPPTSAPAPSGSASPIMLLEILAGQAEAALPLFDLQTRSSMDPARYGESLKSLRDAGYIEIDGDAPDQIVHLTSRGSEVVRLAQPT